MSLMEKEEIEKVRKAGEIHKKLVEFARGIVNPGTRLIDIADKIDEKIIAKWDKEEADAAKQEK